VRRDFRSIGAGAAIFVELLDSRGEAMGGTPPLTQRFYLLYRLLLLARIAVLRASLTFFP
jgi:hypothetical protein